MMEEENDALIIAFALRRFRHYQHQAKMRGDTTQVKMIQEDREWIMRSLILSGRIDKIFPSLSERKSEDVKRGKK